jgi:hypothetical protein
MISFDLNKSLELLDRAPTVIETLLSGLSEEWIMKNEGPDTFSPYDVVGHLVHGETTDWVARTKKILSDNDKDLMLDKKGIHPKFGEVTLRQLLSTWTVHDLGHIGQIVRVMAKQYKENVGPWVEYLRILKD